MDEAGFAEIERALTNEGLEAGFARLVEKFLSEKNYPALFEARLLKKRLELGLPAFQSGPVSPQTPEEVLSQYEKAQIEAAREAGRLFLADGQIHRAWPYFRALGEKAPIREALERAEPSEDEVDGLIEVAFHEAVHPRRGFEWILRHYGTCRAITNFSHYPNDDGRRESARLLVDHLYGELLDNIQRAIESVEGRRADTESLAEAIAGRDWLFEGGNYYLDTSHVASVVQMSVEWDDLAAIRKAIELADYGSRLDEMYQFKGDPPFEDVYRDTAIYLRALLGEKVDEAIEHFRRKLPAEPDPFGSLPAQTLVKLMVRVGRPQEAIDVAEKYFERMDPQFLRCPSAMELCQMAGDYERMAEIARRRGDLLGYAAARAAAMSAAGAETPAVG